MNTLVLLAVLLLPVKSVKVYTCENDYLDISCPKGSVIRVTAANYGRTSMKICLRQPAVSTSCRAENSLQIVKDACEGVRTCISQISNYMFGEPCEGTWKYLEVDYICEPTKAPSKRKALICEAHYLNLTCPLGEVIKIADASYGRSNRITCPRMPMDVVPCHSKNSFTVIQQICESFNHCYVQVLNPVFADPCENTWKYLTVDWDCIPGNVTYGRSFACEVANMDVKCPQGKTINVLNAEYGRHNRILCPHHHILTENCTGKPFDVAKGRCQGLNTCGFTVFNDFSGGDPCPGTRKYASIYFSCQEESKDLNQTTLLCYYNELLGYTEDIALPDLCTHLAYFVGLSDVMNGNLLSKKSTLLPRLGGLKRRNPQLVTLLTINPPTDSLDNEKLFEALTAYGFDGVEVLWSRDVNQILDVSALKNLKDRLAETHRILTLTFVQYADKIDSTDKITEVARIVDLFTVAPFNRLYDRPSIVAPLDNTELSMRNAVEVLVNIKEVPKEKLLLGLPFFGMLTQSYFDVTGRRRTTTQQKSYKEICKLVKGRDWEEHWDVRTSTPYAVGVNGKDGTISFDNHKSMRKKLEIVESFGLRGATIFDIQFDDTEGACDKEYSLSLLVKNFLNIYFDPFTYNVKVKNFIYEHFDEE